MSSASIYSFVTAMLCGKTSRPAPRVSTLVPFITIMWCTRLLFRFHYAQSAGTRTMRMRISVTDII